MKTTEELRKEIEQLKIDEFDACLDFSHKIKPLEERLKAAEQGDLIFEDVQLQSKLAYVNDLFSNSGIPFVLARKSDLIEFTSVENIDTFYRQLALFYRRRRDDNGLSLFDTFDKATMVGDLFEQISLVENQLDLLGFLCSLTSIKGIPPYFSGQLGDGEISLYYFDAIGGFPFDGSNLFIKYDSEVDLYSLRFERLVQFVCEGGSKQPSSEGTSSEVTVQFVGKPKLTLKVSKENVRSSDLKSALEELKTRLLELTEKGKHKVTVELTLITK